MAPVNYRVRVLVLLAAMVALVLLTTQETAAAPYTDYDNLRELYELLLLRNEGLSPGATTRYAHQMERKGGRSPSLRLRFGRRSDPLWGAPSSVSADGEMAASN